MAPKKKVEESDGDSEEESSEEEEKAPQGPKPPDAGKNQQILDKAAKEKEKADKKAVKQMISKADTPTTETPKEDIDPNVEITEEKYAAAQKIQARARGKMDRKRVVGIKQDNLLSQPRRDMRKAQGGSDNRVFNPEERSTKKVKKEMDNYTRVPEGLSDTAMYMTGKTDMKAAFDMIDVAGSGTLNRDGARKWLRCMGWCATTQELDRVLNRGKSEVLMKFWDLATLTSIAEKNAQRPNGSVEDLQSALRRLAGGKARITRQRLAELSQEPSPLSQAQMKDIFNVLGVKSTGTADCDALAHKVLSAISQPPSLQERGSGEN